MQLTTAVRTAADSLQLISEATAGTRGRGAATLALVLRAVEHALDGGERGGFLRRRAEQEVAELSGAERACLARLLLLVDSPAGMEGDALRDALVGLACGLESARGLPEAEAVMEVARAVAPGSAEVALHAGRVARKQGKRQRALELYRTARDLDGEGGGIARLARVGEAAVSYDPEAGLGEVLRDARAAGDGEAVAVVLEERARLRRARGDRRGAGLDLCRSALRYADPVDRARVAHQLADLYVAGDDPHAAREALLLALAVGDASQREHARGRLHAVSRDLGDRVGTRRWRSLRPPPLVSLSARPRVPIDRSEAPRLARWRERITTATG